MTIVVAAILALVFATPANAQPSPPLISSWLEQPAQLTPDTAYCADTYDSETLGNCAAGLTNQFRNSIGAPNPGYSYVTGIGGTIIPFCGYAFFITLYCDENVRFGQMTLDDVLKQRIVHPQLYAAFLGAHESAHHSQTVVGGKHLTDTFYTSEGKPDELQADCFGGAAIRYLMQQGIFSYEDAQAMTAMLERAPPLWTHGSGQERNNAFWIGFNAPSVAVCIGGAFIGTPLF